MVLLINVLSISGWFVPKVIDELVNVDLMFAPVDVTHVYVQIAMVWCLRQPLPLMIVYTQDYAVILATEVVSILWVLKVIEDSDLNDIVRRMIHVLAFLQRVFGPVA